MSFVERNKTWILPALALGAAAVVYLNVTTLSDTAPPKPLPSPTLAGAEAPPPATTPAPVPGADAHVWDDLLPLAVVPAGLESREAFERRSLSALGAAELNSALPPEPVLRPATEPGRPMPAARTGSATPGTPAPSPDFLIQGPTGSKAWFDGRGYRPGQSLQGQPFQIQSINLDPDPQVRLKGSDGLSTRSTRRTAPPSKELP